MGREHRFPRDGHGGRIDEAERNIAGESQAGRQPERFAVAGYVTRPSNVTQRVQHAHLERTPRISWLDERHPSQCALQLADAVSDARRARPPFRPAIRIGSTCRERMGGGFGGKQEMLVEDVCALAVLRPGGR